MSWVVWIKRRLRWLVDSELGGLLEEHGRFLLGRFLSNSFFLCFLVGVLAALDLLTVRADPIQSRYLLDCVVIWSGLQWFGWWVGSVVRRAKVRWKRKRLRLMYPRAGVCFPVTVK